MSIRRTIATAKRALAQLAGDRRTLALLFVVPPLLLFILRYVFDSEPRVFDAVSPMLLGIFPMVMMFLVTSIATLRERRSGTLERLMTMPVSKADFVFGYALAFALVATLQAVITCAVLLGAMGVSVAGGFIATMLGAVAAALLGTSLGLLFSAFAATEFQAVQFMPAVLFPQLLVCGLFIARDKMAEPLQWFANVMPLAYSVDAMKQVTEHSEWTATHTTDLAIILGVSLVALILGALSIRRRRSRA